MLGLTLTEIAAILIAAVVIVAPVTVVVIAATRGQFTRSGAAKAKPPNPPEEEDERIARIIRKTDARIAASQRSTLRENPELKPPHRHAGQ